MKRLRHCLSQTQGQLRSEWEGRVFQRFDDEFNQLKPKAKEFSSLMNQSKYRYKKTTSIIEENDRNLSCHFGVK